MKKNTQQNEIDEKQYQAENSAENQISESAEKGQVEGDIQSLSDQLMRLSADFTNYKRRVEKERASWIAHSKADVLKALLPFIDDFERALAQGQKETAADAMLEGFVLIQKNLHKALKDLGVVKINDTGAFDPKYHEALMHVADETVASGDVVEVLSPGYRMGDVVIRHAKVSVAQ